MSDEMILVNKAALLTVMRTAGDATCDEDTSKVYRNSGNPSTWFDHYMAADQILTDNLNESHTTISPEKIIQAIESILKVEQINSGMYPQLADEYLESKNAIKFVIKKLQWYSESKQGNSLTLAEALDDWPTI